MPGLQAVKESGVHLKIHRLANLATVLATLQKERVPRLEKIVADEVCPSIRIIIVLRITSPPPGRSWSSWINAGFTLGDGELKATTWHQKIALHNFASDYIAFLLQVKHYQFRQVCLATGLNPAPSPDTLLLAWARSAPGLEQVFVFSYYC